MNIFRFYTSLISIEKYCKFIGCEVCLDDFILLLICWKWEFHSSVINAWFIHNVSKLTINFNFWQLIFFNLKEFWPVFFRNTGLLLQQHVYYFTKVNTPFCIRSIFRWNGDELYLTIFASSYILKRFHIRFHTFRYKTLLF